jgi:hypothetical protein
VIAAACGTTLDADGLEMQLADQLGGRFPGSTWSVTCPNDVEPAQGATFACEAMSDRDQSFGIEVTQDDAEGSLTWRIVEV